ncbi:hypothetical protein POTOM_056812 [Populus tomentosa]|uniref:Tudor domain-containing protein n=1 Tax=Populus tomentosa TaxID=118781 RepID=A0A8X8BXA2_POPTO|nr:hypothetical protein POTOM_056812 [Populus tomentosa]
MASSNSDKELEQQLLEAGTKLLNPPSSLDDLLPLLDQVENCLSKVEQSPLKSMQNALSPSQNALVTDQLFRHSNIDVKVAVASCISEITRITAPDAPYDDDQMKEVFQLIVSSFENLDDKSSRSYVKRASILETVAKVRSCVVMLDLECDALIIEMFQHFFKAVRDYHPENVLSSMETIMSLVLEESEDISVELLSPLLASVKKGDEEALPVAQKLGEKVLETCATKVKPYLIQAVKSLGVSLNDYSDIVGSMCQEISGNIEQKDVHAGDENKVDEEETTEVATPKQADPANDKSPKSAVSNGVAQTGEDDSLADSYSLKKQEDNHTDQLKSIDMPSIGEPAISDAEKVVNTESEAEQTSKKSAEKSPTKLTEPSESFPAGPEKEAEELPDDKTHGEDIPSSHKDQSAEEAISSENIKETVTQPSSPKASEGESVPVASPSVGESPPDESVSKKGGRSRKKESLNKHSAPSSDDVPKKVSDGTSDSEVKLHKHSGKKAFAGTSSEDKTPMMTDASKKESGTTSEPEAKSLKQSSKEVDTSKKESDTASEPEAKPLKQSSKKLDASKRESDTTGEPEAKPPKQSSKKADASRKESNTTGESEAKPLKQSSKKVDGSSSNDGLSLKQSEDKKRLSRGKAASEKHATKSSTKDDDKEKTPSTKSAAKSAKEEQHLEETPVTSTKRKRGDEKGSDIKEFDENVVGSKVKVWWPKDRQFYEGKIESFDPIKKKHKVVYTDGDEEILILKKQRFELIDDDSESEEEEATDHPSPETSSEAPLKKRMKTSSDKSSKQGKVDASPKRGSGASSSKSKIAAAKSGGKSKEAGKTGGKSVDESKVKKSDDRGKTKDHTPKSGSKSDYASKTASKSKNDNLVTSKTSKSKEDGTSTPKISKSKHETPKVSSSSAKGKASKSGGKSDVNGAGKLKPGSSKVKEIDDEETSTDSEKVQQSAKVKTGSSSKGGSEAKSGKRRRRV